MSFDALTVTGLVAAVLCAGFLIALISRDDAGRIPRSGFAGPDETDAVDRAS